MMPKVEEEDDESDNDDSQTPTIKRFKKSSRKLVMKIDSKKGSSVDLMVSQLPKGIHEVKEEVQEENKPTKE